MQTASAEPIRQEDIKNLLVLFKQRRPLAADETTGTGTRERAETRRETREHREISDV